MRRQVIDCDRCGEPVSDSNDERGRAGRAYAATFDGTDKVGTSQTPADLCGGCMSDLVIFMGGRELAPASKRRSA